MLLHPLCCGTSHQSVRLPSLPLLGLNRVGLFPLHLPCVRGFHVTQWEAGSVVEGGSSCSVTWTYFVAIGDIQAHLQCCISLDTLCNAPNVMLLSTWPAWSVPYRKSPRPVGPPHGIAPPSWTLSRHIARPSVCGSSCRKLPRPKKVSRNVHPEGFVQRCSIVSLDINGRKYPSPTTVVQQRTSNAILAGRHSKPTRRRDPGEPRVLRRSATFPASPDKRVLRRTARTNDENVDMVTRALSQIEHARGVGGTMRALRVLLATLPAIGLARAAKISSIPSSPMMKVRSNGHTGHPLRRGSECFPGMYVAWTLEYSTVLPIGCAPTEAWLGMNMHASRGWCEPFASSDQVRRVQHSLPADCSTAERA